MAITITLLDASGSGASDVHRFEQDSIVIGRDPSCDLQLAEDRHPQVSGQHCRLSQTEQGLQLEDLGSSNGTYLNHERLTTRQMVTPQDAIRLGPQGPRLQVRVGQATAGATLVVDAPASLKKTTIQKPVSSERKGVGMTTLQTSLAQATKHERRRTTKMVGLITLVLGAAAAWAMYTALTQANQAEDMRQQLLQQQQQVAKQGNKLGQLDQQLSQGQQQLSTVMTSLSQQQDHLRSISNNASLDEAERQKQLAAVQERIAGLQSDLSKAHAELSSSIKEKEDWAGTVAARQAGVFLCVGANTQTRQVGIGTAFALASNKTHALLASNAHVVQMLQQTPTARVLQNETGRPLKIEKLIAHPNFSGARSPDIGLIKVALPSDLAPVPAFTLASHRQLENIAVGTHLGTIGFPGELQRDYLKHVNQSERRFEGVIATFKDGWIGRLTDYEGKATDLLNQVLIQHSASLSGGTSGSPMFLHDGTVVAVSNSSVSMVLARTKTGNKAPSVLSASEIAFAIRADELRQFITDTDWAKAMLDETGGS